MIYSEFIYENKEEVLQRKQDDQFCNIKTVFYFFFCSQH